MSRKAPTVVLCSCSSCQKPNSGVCSICQNTKHLDDGTEKRQLRCADHLCSKEESSSVVDTVRLRRKRSRGDISSDWIGSDKKRQKSQPDCFKVNQDCKTTTTSECSQENDSETNSAVFERRTKENPRKLNSDVTKERPSISMAKSEISSTLEKPAKVANSELVLLTDYLSPKTNESKDQSHLNLKANPPPPTLYGLPIPKATPLNTCSGCLGALNQELKDQPILLCDGPNCHREYHMQCCVPSLPSLPPEGEIWLCQDCSPEGSTKSLIQYLENMDQAKSEFLSAISPNETDSEYQFLLHLLRQDSQENNLSADCRFPESEIERSATTHDLALCDSSSLGRTRGGGNDGRKVTTPDACLGKPIRLYNAAGNQYHGGRIVDYRTRTTQKRTGHVLRDTEFLVRFPAGSGDRKTPYQHWITLEEHALAIGMTLVWAHIVGKWTPALLWMRSARDLVPVQNLLNESNGEIHYMTRTGDTTKGNYFPKNKQKIYALARTMGANATFALINVREQAIDLFSEKMRKNRNSPQSILSFTIAKNEHSQQGRVRAWRDMPQVNPVHTKVLSSRDWYTLPPLIPTNRSIATTLGPTRVALCPSIIHGLDRAKILKQLHQRGIIAELTKDDAASLSCELVPVNAHTLEEERWSRNS